MGPAVVAAGLSCGLSGGVRDVRESVDRMRAVGDDEAPAVANAARGAERKADTAAERFDLVAPFVVVDVGAPFSHTAIVSPGSSGVMACCGGVDRRSAL